MDAILLRFAPSPRRASRHLASLARPHLSLPRRPRSPRWGRTCRRLRVRVLCCEQLPRLLRAFPTLKRLDLSTCAWLDDASLAAAVAGLRSVHLARANGVGWRGVEALVAACAKLEAVDLSPVALLQRRGPRLATSLVLWTMVQVCSQKSQLRLDKCLVVTDMGLAIVVDQ